MEKTYYTVYGDDNIHRSLDEAVRRFGIHMDSHDIEMLCWEDDGNFYAYDVLGRFETLEEAVSFADTIPVSTIRNRDELVIKFVWIEDDIFSDDIEALDDGYETTVDGKRVFYVDSSGETWYARCAGIDI